MYVCMYIYIYDQQRCISVSLPMQINAWETYSDFVRKDHYTRTSRCCETVTCNCVLKRSETLLFKGRYRHSFREIDNTKLHNTCNLSPPWRADKIGGGVVCARVYWRVEKGLRKGFVRKIIIRMRNKNKTFLYAYSFVRVNVHNIMYIYIICIYATKLYRESLSNRNRPLVSTPRTRDQTS